MLQRPALAEFRRQLLGWFRQYRRDLPWRRTKDPYRIWLSEIMLQQTRVAAVIPYYERFLDRFPDIYALATAPQEEVLRLWSGLGYYSRARNLQRAAQEIVTKHGGVFPRDEKDALELPGIGSYTAAAILSIAYGARYAVLDGNVARVLARIFAVRGDLRDAKRWQSLQKSADGLLDPKSSGDWNQAMMDLGATLCTPQSPQCLLCPVTKFCQARKLGIAESLPAKRKKRATENITLAAAVLLDPHRRNCRKASLHTDKFPCLCPSCGIFRRLRCEQTLTLSCELI
jgi:A/G-specific adenine glycosylase